MTIDFLVFEDSLLETADVREGLAMAAAEINLSANNIELRPQPPIQVQSLSTLRQCISQAESVGGEARVVCVDMDLVQSGLLQEEALGLHNSSLPLELGLAQNDGRVAAGFLLAWKILQSKHPRQLLVFATESYGTDRTEEQGRRMQLYLLSHVPIRILRGGLSHPERRARYIKIAVGWWVDLFLSPLSRLHPEGSDDWFSKNGKPEASHPVPHTWAAYLATDDIYVSTITKYLSPVLQMSEATTSECYSALSCSDKERLHEYLMALVGSCAACHVGRGRRLQWRHLPLLATLCAPPPGSWILGGGLLGQQLHSVLPATASEYDGDVLRLLIGGAKQEDRGCLRQILEGKQEKVQSELDMCFSRAGACQIKVKYQTLGEEGLKANFDAGVKTGCRPRHDSSAVLYDLHGFLANYGGHVDVGDRTVDIVRAEGEAG